MRFEFITLPSDECAIDEIEIFASIPISIQNLKSIKAKEDILLPPVKMRYKLFVDKVNNFKVSVVPAKDTVKVEDITVIDETHVSFKLKQPENWFGNSNILTTIVNGTDTSYSTFNFIVSSVNDKPVIVSQKTTPFANEYNKTKILFGDMIVTDIEDDVKSLSLAILPGDNYEIINDSIFFHIILVEICYL